MITCMSDRYWPIHTLGAPQGLSPWLRDPGSLTRRIQLRCRHFGVELLPTGFATLPQDEMALLGVSARQQVWRREVLLLADGQPVVFAHSVTAARHLGGAWQALRALGPRPLGALLFAHPQVVRQPLHCRGLSGRHVLYRRAAALLERPPRVLWARRSLFLMHDAPLLVTEVFLPAILDLSHDPR